MSDTSTTTTKTRESVADRQWIDASGNEVDGPELATGIRYYDKPTKKGFVYQTGMPAGSHVVMLACFGAMTKAGNIRSTLVNGPKGDPNADPIPEIDAWFEELINNSNWAADRVGGGIRVQAEPLARAIAFVKGQHGPDDHLPYLEKINNRIKVVDKGSKDGKEILYSTFAMRNKEVERKYNELLPQHAAAPEVSDL